VKWLVLVFGKTVGKEYPPLLMDYCKRIGKYCDFEYKEIPNSAPSSISVKEIQEREYKILSQFIKKGDCLVLMDEKGKEYNSVEWASFMEQQQIRSSKRILFVIGGAYGFTDLQKQEANHLISLSKMTFTHQMARLILLEQLYRGFTILNNQPYHHNQ